MKLPAAKLLGKVGPGVRAGIAAGLTAGIVMSLMVVGHSGGGSVNVHNTATDAPVDETTSTTVPDTTSTTLAPTTTTTVAPATTTTTLSLEQRLARLEATTTTTTAPKSVAPTVSVQDRPSVVDGVVTATVMFFNHQDARTKSLFPNPAVRVRLLTTGDPVEVVAPLPAEDHGTFTVPFPGVDPTTGLDLTVAQLVKAVDTEWTGGSLPGGAGMLEK